MSKPYAKLVSTVKCGLAVGAKLRPHQFKDGAYVASLTRFKRDYIRVFTLEQLYDLARKGYKIRMSDCDNPRGPSLVWPEFE
jgi:hypothetical protein